MQKLIQVKKLNECSQGERNFSLVARTKLSPAGTTSRYFLPDSFYFGAGLELGSR